jgi:uncharacterized membrane protein
MADAASSRRRSPWHGHPGVRSGNQLTRGERAADHVRNRLGSWGFVGLFVAFMAAWAILNSTLLRGHAFDPYPYILLNLFLSMLAGLQGAILLIAAKRADQVSAETAIHTLKNTETLKDLIERNNELTEQIERLTEQMEAHLRGAE